MVHYYIEIMFEINKDRSCLADERLDLLRSAFSDELVKLYATEEHYANFIYLLYEIDPTDEQILQLHREAVDKFPQAWIDYMKYYIRRNDEERVHQLYVEVKTQVDEHCTDIHYTYLQYLFALPSEDRMTYAKQALLEIAHKTSDVFTELKAKILIMIRDTIGVEYAQLVYKKFVEFHKECLIVHNTMLDIQRDEVIVLQQSNTSCPCFWRRKMTKISIYVT